MASPDALHAEQPVLHAGPSPGDARLVAILLHCRGASARDILALANELSPTDVAYVAPQAARSTWYPYSFLAPIDQNEPWLGSALRLIAGLVEGFAGQGIPAERLAVIGFSQGACLALEFAARHPRRYAAVIAFTGGLIGPPGTSFDHSGDLAGTPVFVGSSDVDPHVPLERVQETTTVLRRMGGRVDERIYPGMGHTINVDELRAADALLTAGTKGSRG